MGLPLGIRIPLVESRLLMFGRFAVHFDSISLYLSLLCRLLVFFFLICWLAYWLGWQSRGDLHSSPKEKYV